MHVLICTIDEGVAHLDAAAVLDKTSNNIGMMLMQGYSAAVSAAACVWIAVWSSLPSLAQCAHP